MELRKNIPAMARVVNELGEKTRKEATEVALCDIFKVKIIVRK
jgi:hypothetical protein